MKNHLIQIIILSLILTFSICVNGHAQESDYQELKRKYEALIVDRDNILAQAKNLLQYKEKCLNLQKSLEELESRNQELTRNIQAKSAGIQALESEVSELEKSQVPLIEERNNLKNSLEKFKIEYKILPKTKKDIARLKRENADLIKKRRQLEAKINKLQEEQFDASAQAEIYRRQLNDFKQRYEEAFKNNRDLEKKVSVVPKKFAELARENRVLVKQTALMHYNLGVFYTENKQYSRAIAEFEKAIELNPDDPYVYYNLGYIYAEYVVNRPKAIEHFRQFLRLTKTDDKDVDWVKKYIITWQTWEGKTSIK